jgi:hypothetical protein
MAWSKATIPLAAAQAIFDGCEFEEITIGGKVAGYRAKYGDRSWESLSLTDLCATLWLAARAEANNVRGHRD